MVNQLLYKTSPNYSKKKYIYNLYYANDFIYIV
jgi:hypothetical protein